MHMIRSCLYTLKSCEGSRYDVGLKEVLEVLAFTFRRRRPVVPLLDKDGSVSGAVWRRRRTPELRHGRRRESFQVDVLHFVPLMPSFTA